MEIVIYYADIMRLRDYGEELKAVSLLIDKANEVFDDLKKPHGYKRDEFIESYLDTHAKALSLDEALEYWRSYAK